MVKKIARKNKVAIEVAFDADVLARLRQHKNWEAWLNNLVKVALSLKKKPRK